MIAVLSPFLQPLTSKIEGSFHFSAILSTQNAWFSKCIIFQWSFCTDRNPLLGASGPTQCTSTSSFWGERGEFVQLGPRWLQNEFQTSFCMSFALYWKRFRIIWAYFLRPKMLKDAKADSTLESLPARVRGRRCIAVGVFDTLKVSMHNSRNDVFLTRRYTKTTLTKVNAWKLDKV